MSFYSKIVDHLNAAVQTNDAAKVALASRVESRESGPQFAGERLEVCFPQVLDAAEEGDFGFGQPIAGHQLQVGEFKCAKEVGQLKEAAEASRFVDEYADFLGRAVGNGRR